MDFVSPSNLDLITTLRLLSSKSRNILLLELIIEVVSEEPYQCIEVVQFTYAFGVGELIEIAFNLCVVFQHF